MVVDEDEMTRPSKGSNTTVCSHAGVDCEIPLNATSRSEQDVADASAPTAHWIQEDSGASSSSATAVEIEDHVLDLTSSQLHSLKGVDLPASLVELDLTANRLTGLDERIAGLLNLKKLSFRQNLLEDVAVKVLNEWPAVFRLEELVLRDNRLTRIPSVSNLNELVVLDVSFNKVTSMSGLNSVNPGLRELYLSSNAIPKIEELNHFKELHLLELGFNKLRRMDGLQELTKLKELWLGKNRLTSVNMSGLTSLTRLSVQNNHLTSMRGFEACVHLEELYLSHNNIAEMEGLETLTNLKILDISSNRLVDVKGLDSLSHLEDLWLNDNNIPTLEGIEAGLQCVKNSLTVIYLERNTCATDPQYVSKLRTMLPGLVQIDSKFFD